MVALDSDRHRDEVFLPQEGNLAPQATALPSEEEMTEALIAVMDAENQPLAYVPMAMGADEAEAHAVLYAEAARLLDLVRFAADHLSSASHPAVLRAYRAYCNEVLDRIDEAMVVT